MESCFTDHFFYLVEGLAVTAACWYLRNRPGAKCLFLKICYTHCEKVVFLHLKWVVLHLKSENQCWTCQVSVVSKILAIKLRPIRLRLCEIKWLKSGQNWGSLIKNQFTHSNSSSNADEKWSKNDDNLMHPDRVILHLKVTTKCWYQHFFTKFTLQ